MKILKNRYIILLGMGILPTIANIIASDPTPYDVKHGDGGSAAASSTMTVNPLIIAEMQRQLSEGRQQFQHQERRVDEISLTVATLRRDHTSLVATVEALHGRTELARGHAASAELRVQQAETAYRSLYERFVATEARASRAEEHSVHLSRRLDVMASAAQQQAMTVAAVVGGMQTRLAVLEDRTSREPRASSGASMPAVSLRVSGGAMGGLLPHPPATPHPAAYQHPAGVTASPLMLPDARGGSSSALMVPPSPLVTGGMPSSAADMMGGMASAARGVGGLDISFSLGGGHITGTE